MNKTDAIIQAAREVNRLLSMPTDARDLSWRQALERSNNALTAALNAKGCADE